MDYQRMMVRAKRGPLQHLFIRAGNGAMSRLGLATTTRYTDEYRLIFCRRRRHWNEHTASVRRPLRVIAGLKKRSLRDAREGGGCRPPARAERGGREALRRAAPRACVLALAGMMAHASL